MRCSYSIMGIICIVICMGCQVAPGERKGIDGVSKETKLDRVRIGEIVGVRASRGEGGVVRVTWPRSDVAVEVDGVALSSAAGFTSWAAFAPVPSGAMVMGDTVVFEDEVSPAMDAAFEHGLEVTALHNHFLFDRPKAYFLHIGGKGEPEALARGVAAVWEAVRGVRERSANPATAFPRGGPVAMGSIDRSVIEAILGHPVKDASGVAKVTLGRTASMDGRSFGASMGLTTWAAFTGSDEQAVVNGDFAMTAREVQPVLRALRRAGIHVVALHNHMIDERPAYYFTHYWGRGPARELAEGLRSALDAQGGAGGR